MNIFSKLTKKTKIIFSVIIVLFFITLLFTTTYGYGKKSSEDPMVSWVSHTEYWRGDNASTIVRIADYKGDPYQISSCNVTILHPDKSIFVNNQAMMQSNIPGNWYRTDSLENQPLGTYEQEVTCTSANGQTIKTSQSFHLNPALEEIKTVSQKLTDQNLSLTNSNLIIEGKISDTNQTIVTKIDNLNTNISNLISDINNNLKLELDSTNTNINTKFSELNIKLESNISDLDKNISTNINDVNTSISELINNNLKQDINMKINNLSLELNEKLSAIQNDTNWIIQNAMNNNNEEINSRFDDLNTNINYLINMCSTSDTNNNKLCSEVQLLNEKLDTIKLEQSQYLTDINNNTKNTFELLSINFSQKIDSMLIDIGIIKEQTNDINNTTHEILNKMNEDIDVRIIS